MNHGVDGRKFGRNTSHRVAMFRNMANSVIAKEQVITTVEKAKEVRRVVDRLITLGKHGDPASRRLAFDRTRDKEVVKKLFSELATRYKARKGGYTRVLKMAELRRGDAARMAVLELVDHPVIDRKRKVKAQATDAEAATKDVAPKDPFNRFRKLFGEKTKKAGATKAPRAEAGARKTRGSTRGGGRSGGEG